jgi:UDPglucose 6-dehydrogenase
MKTIGVIGLGYVGTAVQKGFESTVNVVTYDIAKESTETSVQGVLSKAQIIFICVPTPMNMDGTCNIDIIRDVLSKMVTLQTEYKPICVIKSTITPGTTNKLAEEFPHLTFCFNPEFLTEKNYINDFISQVNIILGYVGDDRKEILPVYDLYSERFTNANITFTSAKEAEMIKYVANTFLSTKIAYLNEIYQICQTVGIDYNRIIKVLVKDTRLGDTHWNVPGHDGHFGFGGTCFPKDLNALIQFGKQNGQSTPLLEAVWNKNLEVRPERDWELDRGRAVI